MAGAHQGAGATRACPRCGARLPVAPRGPSIGKPFAQCAGCEALVAREGAHEWDLLPAAARLAHLGRAAGRALAAGLGAAAAQAAGALGTGSGWRPGTTLAWLGAGLALGALVEGTRLTRAIRRSRRRLSDPMYRAKLVEHELATSARR
jgi:hypothetical protein